MSIAELSSNNNIPSLALVASVYGDTVPIEWLRIQFGSLNDYAENGVGITDEQLTELSHLVLAGHYDINLAEICLFIARFKLGMYGEFYGAVGPMKISAALQKFRTERRIDIDRYEREQERIRAEKQHEEWAKTSITHEEYLKLKPKNEL